MTMEFFYRRRDIDYGPFSEECMLSWYRASFLPSSLSIRAHRNGHRVFKLTLGDLVKRNGPANPFIHVDKEEEDWLRREAQITRLQQQYQACSDELAALKKSAVDSEKAQQQQQPNTSSAEEEENGRNEKSEQVDELRHELGELRAEVESLRQPQQNTKGEEIETLRHELSELRGEVAALRQPQQQNTSSSSKAGEEVDALCLALAAVRDEVDALRQQQQANSSEDMEGVLSALSSQAAESAGSVRHAHARIDRLDSSSDVGLRHVCRTLNVSYDVLDRLRDMEHWPLLECNEQAADCWLDEASELNRAMQNLRKKWVSTDAARYHDLDQLFRSTYATSCDVCEVVFHCVTDMFTHAISVEHIRELRRDDGPGYSTADVCFWEWVLDILDQDEEKE